MGLLKARGSDVRLSPVKGGRMRHGQSSLAQGVGWSGAFKRGLPSQEPERKSPIRDQGPETIPRVRGAIEREQTPGTKRARFMLERKEIRLPGRESLPDGGGGLISKDDEEEDDDDGLDII